MNEYQNDAYFKDRVFENTLKQVLHVKKLPDNCQSRVDFKYILEKARNDHVEPSKRGLYLFENAIIVGSHYEILKKAGAESGVEPIDIKSLEVISRLFRQSISQSKLRRQASSTINSVSERDSQLIFQSSLKKGAMPAKPKSIRDMELDNIHFELAMKFTLDINSLPGNCKTIPDFIGWVKAYRAATKAAKDLNLYIINNQMRLKKAGYEKKHTAKLIHEDQMISIFQEILY